MDTSKLKIVLMILMSLPVLVAGFIVYVTVIREDIKASAGRREAAEKDAQITRRKRQI